MKSNPELVLEFQKTKTDIKKAVLAGTQFIFNCMTDGKVPSYSPSSRKFGLWPAAEMANFLISNQILPKTCSNQIDSIIDFLISKFKAFSDGTGAWHATVNGTREYYSSQTTGYCAYVLKLYYNEFLTNERKNKIKNIITQSEKYIISKQQDAGFWTPCSSTSDTVGTDGINYADFFYSYHSYIGIKILPQYNYERSNIVLSALSKAKGYFYKFADHLIQSYKQQTLSDSAKIVLLSNISKVLQVLNDFDEENIKSVIAELHRISLEIFDIVNRNDFMSSAVTLDRLDTDSQRTYHNNTPFDVYFALREEKISAQNLLRVVDWYLNNQDAVKECWYLNADPNTNQSTWTTIEALLVLSDAYDMLSEELYLREFQSLEDELKKNEAEKTALLKTKEQYKQEIEQYEQKLNLNIKKIKKQNKIWMGVSVGISIFISVICFVLFVCVVSIGMNPVLEKFIDVVIFSLVGNAIFQVIAIVIQIAAKGVKELEINDLENNSDNK